MTADTKFHPAGFFKRTDCRLCNSKNLVSAFALQPTPPANDFVAEASLSVDQQKYPLEVMQCGSCGHVQLGHVVDPTLLFSNYVYVSGTSKVFVKHFQDMAHAVTERFAVKSTDLVFEIGSNDGTLLKAFKDLGSRVLGVDPAEKIAASANAAGTPTIVGFFNQEMARSISLEQGKARVVLANNVFAHIDHLDEVVRGISEILSDDGVFIFEVSYLDDVLKNTLFDTIYHEHLSYHSLSPLVGFFKRLGFKLFDAERVDTHGGSIRGYVCRSSHSLAVSQRLNDLLAKEVESGITKPECLKNFSYNIEKLGTELRACLHKLKGEGARIAGFGAPAKATTLMYEFGIGKDLVDYIVDDSPLKQGLFSPGLHIPIYPSTKIYSDKPDILVLLAWNFAGPIVHTHSRFKEQGGRFVLPVPHVQMM